MKILYDLEKPFSYSWNLATILIIIIVVLIVSYGLIILIPFFYKKYFNKIVDDIKLPSLKSLYIKKLEKLLHMVKNGRINNKDAYLKLSVLIREFVKKTTGINVLSYSKEEIKEMNVPALSALMEEYYPPEFAKNIDGDIVTSIRKSIEVISKWKQN
jgi:hypothetical protein